MDLYRSLFRSVLFPAWEEKLRKRPMLSHLRYLERTQWRSLDELRAIQSGNLKRLVQHAYDNVPYYRKRFDEIGVHPSDVRSADDIVKLPLLTRDDARVDPKTRESTTPPFVAVRKTTGGTTGQPLLFGYDAGSEHWRHAMKWRGYGWAGYQPGDRSLHYWGAALERKPPRTTRAKIAVDRWVKRETYFQCAVQSEPAMREVVDYIRAARPEAILCYTQAGGELARFINKEGLRDWPDTPVICGAERVFEHDRRDLERAFGPRVFETYGCREMMLVASECAAHEGLHTSMENLVVEVLVDEGVGDDGRPRFRTARVGETGMIALTDLHNVGMPFIRYVNGDLGTVGPTERCPCGRALPRLASVDGRVTDVLRDADGSAVSGLIFNIVFTFMATVAKQFQVVQHKDRSITLRLIPTPAFDATARGVMERDLAHHFKGLPIRIDLVDDIPTTAAGKRRFVIVET